MTVFKRVGDRLKEPSTWAGLAVLGAMFGLDPTKIASIHDVFVAATAAAAVLLPEKPTGL